MGAPVSAAIDHVLGTFRKEEWPLVHESITIAADAALMVLTEGPQAAMNRYNTKALQPEPAEATDENDA